MFKKKKTYVILALVILIIGGYFYQKSQKPKVEYTTATAEKGTLAQTVSVTGKLVAPEETDLSFKVSGRIESILVDVGDKVTEGQKVATVDRGTLSQELAQARQEVATQKNTLYNMKRNNRRLTFNAEEMEAQRARIKKAEAAAGAVSKQISETTLYAPISGIVIRKNVEVGEVAVANAVTANTSVVTVAREGNLEIETNVPESDIAKIVLGQNADVTLDAFPVEAVFSARVTKIEPASTVIQDVVYYKVNLLFDHYDNHFKNGMSTDIDIKTAEKNDVVYVPERAVKIEDGKKYVEILKDEKNAVTEKVFVETGLKGNEGMIEIVKGLKGGEKVVTLSKDV